MKRALSLIAAFAAGFAVHMFLFTDLVPSSIYPTQPSSTIQATGAPAPTSEFSRSVIYIEYKNGRFNPSRAVSKVGNRIVVRNMDAEEKMSLDSDAVFLTTPRPYGLSEQIDVVPRESGTFTVRNKEHESAQFTVVVKP